MNCNYEKLLKLSNFISSIPQEDYPCHSRIHKLHSLSSPDTPCYVKRDDELSFGISGTKLRKLRTLIASLKLKKISHACVIGTFHSTNVLGLCQLLIENTITPILFLLQGTVPNEPIGNFLLTRLFVKEESIIWVPRSSWKQVDLIADEHSKILLKQGHTCSVISEGSNQKESFFGAMTLAIDIIENEKKQDLDFSHIFLEAGTGLTAQALIIAYAFLKKKTKIHVMQAHQDTDLFMQNLHLRHKELEEVLQCEIYAPIDFSLHKPITAKAFGATNKAVFSCIRDVARNEGLLLDPVWSSKLFLLLKDLLDKNAIHGPTLILHSGGATSLFGYQDKLLQVI